MGENTKMPRLTILCGTTAVTADADGVSLVGERIPWADVHHIVLADAGPVVVLECRDRRIEVLRNGRVYVHVRPQP